MQRPLQLKLMYFTAIAIIVMDMYGVSKIEAKTDFCSFGMIWALWGVRWLNIVLPLLQASILTMLYKQLNHLQYCSDTFSDSQINNNVILFKKQQQYLRSRKTNLIVAVVLSLLCVAIYVIDSMIWLHIANSEGLCHNAYAKVRELPDARTYYISYLIVHTILGLCIITWLTIVTIGIARILNKISQDDFTLQKRRIQIILGSFVTSIIVWSILDAYTGVFGWTLYSDFTQIILTLMIQPAFGNFIPIAILMYTHLSNVTSIQ